MNNYLFCNYKILILQVVIYFPLPITSQVCKETVTKVSECPSNASELEKRASEKCSTACGNSEGDIKYKYHCVPDSTHKGLYEMCAIPKYLFDYCPAYDQKGELIQKDESRPCNSSSSRPFYNSSELFFCDLTNCLESPTSTTSDSPSETTDMTTTPIPDGERWYRHLIWISAIVGTFLIIYLIIFVWKRKQSSESSNCLELFTPDCRKPHGKKRQENGGSNGSLIAVQYNTKDLTACD